MGEYIGPERRKDPHYCHIGVERFGKVEREVDEMWPIVTNGLSSMPKVVWAGFAIMISLLITIVSIVGSTRVKSAQLEQRLDDHIERSDEWIEWGQEQNDINRALIEALEENNE